MPCAEMYERYLANGSPGKENCPEWKPVDASTFGRVMQLSMLSRWGGGGRPGVGGAFELS